MTSTASRTQGVTTRVGAGLTTTGLVVLLVGTFLPWLRSGTVLRDSYQSIGALRGLPTPPGGAASVLLYGWLAVIPLCAGCVACYALRLRRTSAALACLVSVLAATGSIVAMTRTGTAGPVGFALAGPTVTLIGAALALIGGTIILRGLHRARYR